MEVTTDKIKELREKSGAGVMACRSALLETAGDIGKALECLRQKGLVQAKKKTERVAKQGLITSYIHSGGKIGAMIEINCETDFVARTAEFKELAHDLAMQIAAASPRFISSEEIPPDAEPEPQPVCLLSQPFIKDPTRTVQEIIAETIAKVGENIKVRRFARFELGADH